jgi:hypothetical protein
MIKKDIFYLFLVGIFLVLSALSFYWFNNVDSYTNTHNTKKNTLVENSANAWNKLNNVLNFLDILGHNSKEDNNDKDIYTVNNSIKNSDDFIKKLEIVDESNQKNEQIGGELSSSSIIKIIEQKEIEEKRWYQKIGYHLSKTGLYTFKSENILELGWQNSKGKTYRLNIPY